MIGIIDYGLGNISAFANIFKQLNIPFKQVKNLDDFDSVTKLILPGVGAFDYAMKLLNDSGMRDKLDDLVLNERIPVLGVCVGMQIMADLSEEGVLPGLGWVSGSVRKIDISKLNHKPTIPHMGWNQVHPKKDLDIFSGIDYQQGFYFLHSYYFCANTEDDILAVANYSGDFSCAIHKGNIYGFQFHPEKSLSNGVTLLKNFANLVSC